MALQINVCISLSFILYLQTYLYIHKYPLSVTLSCIPPHCCLAVSHHAFLHSWVVLHMFMFGFPSSFIQTLHLPFKIMIVFCKMGYMLHFSSHWSCYCHCQPFCHLFPHSPAHTYRIHPPHHFPCLCVWLFLSCCHSLTSSLIITVSNLLSHSLTMHLSPPICVPLSLLHLLIVDFESPLLPSLLNHSCKQTPIFFARDS